MTNNNKEHRPNIMFQKGRPKAVKIRVPMPNRTIIENRQNSDILERVKNDHFWGILKLGALRTKIDIDKA
jgi:hypothetical protein